jgi:hypothetical protein
MHRSQVWDAHKCTRTTCYKLHKNGEATVCIIAVLTDPFATDGGHAYSAVICPL